VKHGLLDGVRVVDLGGAAAAYAARMFMDLGAEVVMVEPRGGGDARRVPPLARTSDGRRVSAHFAYMAAGKRSVTIAVERAPGRDLLEFLVGTADILLTTASVDDARALGLTYDEVHGRHPRLVYTSVTPFGLTGPRRRWRGDDLLGWASSAAMPSIGDTDRPPLAPGGGLAYMTAGLNAAMGAMAALATRDQTGLGQLVDISVQEATISVAMEVSPLVVLEGGFRQQRTGKRKPAGPLGHYATKDGAVSIVAYMPDHWRVLAEWVRDETGVEEILSEEFAGTPVTRTPYAELIDSWIEGLTMRYTKADFFVEAQRRGITVAPVNTAEDVLTDAHLDATDGWVQYEAPDVGPLRAPTPPLHIDGSTATFGDVPRVGEHNRVVFVDELGIGDAEFERLVADGVI